jgi:D-glycero-D-manno-heptose 1,7-bisphosphate phosphatase
MSEWQFMPGIHDCVEKVKAAGFRVIVVTNQPDVAKGLMSRDTVEAFHSMIHQELPVDAIKVCFHIDSDGCECRKPRPGMLQEAAKEWAIDLRRSFIIGDTWRDMVAGRAAQCTTILIDQGYAEEHTQHADAIVHSLSEAASLICRT